MSKQAFRKQANLGRAGHGDDVQVAAIRREFDPVFENTLQLAIACDTRGIIVSGNAVFDSLYPRYDYRSKPIYFSKIPTGMTDLDLHYQMDALIKDAALGSTGFLDYEVDPDSPNAFYIGWSAAPVRNDAGDVAWILIQAFDYKNGLRKRQELAQVNSELETEVESLKRRSTDLEWTVDTLEGQGNVLVEIADEGELIRLELAAEIEERKRLEAELVRISITDPLTGAFNRRRWLEVGSEELARMQNGYKPFSIISFDIDHFKKVNDTWSHLAGDDVLISFTTVCKAVLGEGAAKFFRIGGEEFVCLLQATDLDTSAALAEDLRQAIEEMEVQTCDETLQVTASLGVTRCQLGESLSNVLSRADKALYQAKDGGRNRVVKI